MLAQLEAQTYSEFSSVRLADFVVLVTPPNSEMICVQSVGTKVVCGMILFFEKKAMLKI